MAKEAKRYGSLLVAQVSHPGRQVPDTIQERPISASDIHLKGKIRLKQNHGRQVT